MTHDREQLGFNYKGTFQKTQAEQKEGSSGSLCISRNNVLKFV